MLPTNAELDYFDLSPYECDELRNLMHNVVARGTDVQTPFRYFAWKEGGFAYPFLKVSSNGKWIYLDRGPGRHTIVSNGDEFYVCRVEEAEAL
jgi:hypothetical protein